MNIVVTMVYRFPKAAKFADLTRTHIGIGLQCGIFEPFALDGPGSNKSSVRMSFQVVSDLEGTLMVVVDRLI